MISDFKVKQLSYLPVLSSHKTNRAVTKHFTNAMLYLPHSQAALLSWLVYESKTDNSFKYSSQMLIRYSKSVEEACKTYNTTPRINTSVKSIRKDLGLLIESGYIWPTPQDKIFLINPMLSAKRSFIGSKEYKEFVRVYQGFKDYSDKILLTAKAKGISAGPVMNDLSAKYMKYFNK